MTLLLIWENRFTLWNWKIYHNRQYIGRFLGKPPDTVSWHDATLIMSLKRVERMNPCDTDVFKGVKQIVGIKKVFEFVLNNIRYKWLSVVKFSNSVHVAPLRLSTFVVII